MKWFEKRQLNYIIAVKLQKPIKLILRSKQSWIEIAPGIQISEFTYKGQKWKSERRFVAVRKDVRKNPKFSGKLLTLFNEEIPIWRYSVFVTNMELPNEQIWNLYRDRADAENRIKELKLDFGADNFCLKKFWATEAAFRFIMISYNLLSLFRHMVLQTKTQHTLSTIKFKCFAIGSWITNHSGKKVLKLSISGKRRSWIEGLFGNVQDFELPFEFSIA